MKRTTNLLSCSICGHDVDVIDNKIQCPTCNRRTQTHTRKQVQVIYKHSRVKTPTYSFPPQQ